MPAVVVAVAAAAVSSAATTLGVGGALFGAGILGSIGAAVVADSVFGAVAGFAVNKIGGSLLAGGGKKSSGGGWDGAVDIQGLKTVVRMSDDTQKIIYGRARIGGTLGYIETYPTAPDSGGISQTGDNLFLHMVICHAGHECDAIEEIYLNDDLVTLDANGFVKEAPYKKNGKSYARIKHHLGSDTQNADSFLVAEAKNWTTAHRLRGICYSYIRLQWNPDIFQNGIPTINVVLRGKKVYDPRTTLTAWSNNAALCVRDYISSRDFGGIPYGFGALSSEIDDNFTIAAANICDENITKLDGSTIKRYTCNGVVDTARTPLNNLEDLLTSMVGTVTMPKGIFRIYAGAYDTPESTIIDESWLSGNIKSRLRIPRQQLFNAVHGMYVAPNKQWQSDSFPEITSPVYEAEDNNERIYTELRLPYTTDSEAAQRIAKTVQRKGREQISLTMPCNYKALQFAVWDTVKINNAARGWNEKVFRIVNLSFDIKQGVVLQLREENSLSYSWSASDAEAVAAAPDTNLPSPSFVAAAGVPQILESLYSTNGGGGTKTRVQIICGASTDALVTLYQFEYKKIAEVSYRVLAAVADTSVTIDDIESGRYDFRVKAIRGSGASSDYSYLLNKEVLGLSARPADVRGLTGQVISSMFIARWNLPADVDVTDGGNILVRHSEAMSGATWENSVSIGDKVSGNSTMVVLPMKAGTYLFKAEDSTGQQSVNAATVSTKDAAVLNFSTISTVTESPLFSGSHSSTCAPEGVLKMVGAGNLDSAADFDSIADFDSLGGIVTSGTYNFAAGIDLGSVKRCRLITSIAMQTVNVLDIIDSRTSNIDDWLDFDGVSGGGSVDARIEVRSTDDNPAGSPTWSAWNALHAADYYARAFQFRVFLTATDPAYNVYITTLGVTAKEII